MREFLQQLRDEWPYAIALGVLGFLFWCVAMMPFWNSHH